MDFDSLEKQDNFEIYFWKCLINENRAPIAF